MSTHHPRPHHTHEKAPSHYRDAFAATAEARAALADDELLSVTLDVDGAASTVMGALPRLEQFHDDMSKLPGTDIERIDQLKTFAQALVFANVQSMATSGEAGDLPKLAARAVELRDMLLADATALGTRGLINPAPLAGIKKAPGYLNTARELGVVAEVLRARWKEIASKTAVQESDLDEAEEISESINGAFADRNAVSPAVSTATSDRQRAYTLMVNAYDHARRAVSYLRWEQDDVDAILPSLWSGRARPTKASDEPPVATAAGSSTTAPQPTANASAKSPAATATPAQTTAPVATPPVASGVPGGSPFTN